MKTWGSRLLYILVIGVILWLTPSPEAANAAYLENISQEITQPDGTILNCYASGDEFFNYLHDSEGNIIIQDPISGYWVYASNTDGEPVPSSIVAGSNPPESAVTIKDISAYASSQRQRAADQQDSHRALTQNGANSNSYPTSGTINNIVVLIRFQGEDEFVSEDLANTYEEMFNAQNPKASLKSYFKEASYNQLTINSTFYPHLENKLVSYQDFQTRGYYQPYNEGANSIGYTGDGDGPDAMGREAELLRNVVNAVRNQVPLGTNLDNNNDGRVDNICFIISGSAGGWNDLLWPHRSVLGGVFINNKEVENYNFQLASNTGVGVLSHEMFHSLGAPDLYHYSQDDWNPVSGWDLMGNFTNEPPQHMCSYMKYRYGKWISSIPEISRTGSYRLKPLSSSTQNCYKITGTGGEYYILEYRAKDGTFENSLTESGLLIYRIDPRVDGFGNRYGPPDEVLVYCSNTLDPVYNCPFNCPIMTNGQGKIMTISSIRPTETGVSFRVKFSAYTYLYDQELMQELDSHLNEPFDEVTGGSIEWVGRRLQKVDMQIERLDKDYDLTGDKYQKITANVNPNILHNEPPNKGWSIFLQKRDGAFVHLGITFNDPSKGVFWVWQQGYNGDIDHDNITYEAEEYFSARYQFNSYEEFLNNNQQKLPAIGWQPNAQTWDDISFIPFQPAIFISPRGDDNNNGDPLTPVKTLQKGIAEAQQGYVGRIYVGNGTYSVGNGLSSDTDRAMITVDGVKLMGGWNIARHRPGSYSTLNGRYLYHYVLQVLNANKVNISGFRICGATESGIGFQNVNESSITDCTVYNCQVQSDNPNVMGIGICLRNSNNNKLDCTVKNNKGSKDGGAIWLGDNSCYNTFQGSVSNNSGCGGIGIEGSYNIIQNATISRNNTGGYGGGVFINGNSNNNEIYAVIENNRAVYGGGVSINAWGSVCQNNTINSVIRNNRAEHGGGVQITEGGASNNYVYGTLTGNVAVLGGGIKITYGGNNTVDALITGNTATGNPEWTPIYGGGIWYNCSSNINFSKIYGNRPDDVRYRDW